MKGLPTSSERLDREAFVYPFFKHLTSESFSGLRIVNAATGMAKNHQQAGPTVSK